jgi:hypothetical protein
MPVSFWGLAATSYYFVFFIFILPALSVWEKGRDLPLSIHHAVMGGKS